MAEATTSRQLGTRPKSFTHSETSTVLGSAADPGREDTRTSRNNSPAMTSSTFHSPSFSSPRQSGMPSLPEDDPVPLLEGTPLLPANEPQASTPPRARLAPARPSTPQRDLTNVPVEQRSDAPVSPELQQSSFPSSSSFSVRTVEGVMLRSNLSSSFRDRNRSGSQGQPTHVMSFMTFDNEPDAGTNS
jgi:hypothetical protein